MKKVAIIGAGVSGLGVAHFLKDRYHVSVFEKENRPGGLIKCRRVNGSLFHTCGGHVFNSKRQDVLDWFWSKLQREDEFLMNQRNSCVFMDKNDFSCDYDIIPYPIENHIYMFDRDFQKSVYDDLDEIDNIKGSNVNLTDYENFGDFLRWRFGKTLFNLYFQPYNEKIWQCDLTTVPMSWMEGKLPMPTTQEIRNNNANHVKEKNFVHSSFWYEKSGGSQCIADKLAEGIDIRYNSSVKSLTFASDELYSNAMWIVNDEFFDKVVFCGNIKDLVKMIEGVDISQYKEKIEALEYHGTTTVFCEIDKNPYTWIYLPSRKYESHRIICTGNLAPTNNDVDIPAGRTTATIEFTDEVNMGDILDNLKRMPLNPKYIDYEYNKYTYPIQNYKTRDMINSLKSRLAPKGLYMTGRFADWEYYNMDVALGVAMDLCETIL